MKKYFNSKRFGLLSVLALCASMLSQPLSAQTKQLTTEQAKAMYSADKPLRHVTVHDPSVTYDSVSKQYYIFGTHRGVAKTSDLQNWSSLRAPWKVGSNNNAGDDQAVVTPVVKKIKKGGAEVDFPAFNAYQWSACIPTHGSNNWGNITGNMWAPDIIWNPTMKKWCQYLSINGLRWNSSIVLLISDKVEGPYEYQGPVIISGFNVDNNANVSYKKTDLELVLGTQSSLPGRYNCSWGNRWPHAIDPSVFFDEEGKLWMAYGSWSGGIWIIELDEATGLRDYDVTYPSTNGTSDDVRSDPYFGKKIAGGRYVSGEGSYIEHIGNYYYLFVTNGGLEAKGGYEMRVFRSKNPNGPYTDTQSRSAIYSSYALNFGVNCDTRGEKLLGPYDDWGFMTLGERAQGHNSVIAADDGKTYLVYHTRFNDGTEGHQVRVHQLYLNERDWLVAAPFEYTGETVTDEDIRTRMVFDKADVPGQYQILIHKYSMDHKNGEEVLPKTILFNEDGTISGAYSGTWTLKEGTSYIQVKINGLIYYGVMVEQKMEPTSIKALCFTACGNSGVNVWGYKMKDDYYLAKQINTTTMPVKDKQTVYSNLYLYNIPLSDGIKLEWKSSNPEILSSKGHYNPNGLTEDVPVELNVKMSFGDYFWADTMSVTVQKNNIADLSPYLNGIAAYYDFDSTAIVNAYNPEQKAVVKKNGTGTLPAAEQDSMRFGNYYHQYFGAAGNCSYTQFVNPLYGKDMADGMTMAFWLKCEDENLWDAIWSFFNTSEQSRLYMTGNAYYGYNNNKGNWIDINHPTAIETNYLPTGKWVQITVTLSRTNGITLYVDGARKLSSAYKYAGSQNGKDIATRNAFDYNEIVDFIKQCPDLYFGYGSFWGSANICYDDLLIYDRALSATEILTLKNLYNRVTDFANKQTSGIDDVFITEQPGAFDNAVYDLMGRKVQIMQKGRIYIKNGKKFVNN